MVSNIIEPVTEDSWVDERRRWLTSVLVGRPGKGLAFEAAIPDLKKPRYNSRSISMQDIPSQNSA